MLMARLPPVQVLTVNPPRARAHTVNLPRVLALMVKLAPPAPIHMAKPTLELIPKLPTLPPEPTRAPLATMVLLIIMPQHPKVLMVKMADTVNTLTPTLNLQATSWPPRLNK